MFSETERIQFDAGMLSVFGLFETLYYQSQLRTGERKLFLAEERALKNVLAYIGICERWVENPYSLDIEFRSYVQSLLLESQESEV